MSFRSTASAIFSAGLLLSIIICGICDLAVSNGFEWSMFTFSSAVFAWAVFFPVIKPGIKGTALSLAAVTVLILPFLAVLDMLTGGSVIAVGVPVAVIGVVYLWCVFAAFKALKRGKLFSAAVSLLLAIPVCLGIDLIIANMFDQPFVDVWDWLAFAVIVMTAVIMFVFDTKRQRRKR